MRPRPRGRSRTRSNIETRRTRRVVAWRRSDSDEGSVLVEFALVFPIFALMLFGMVQFGLVFTVGLPCGTRCKLVRGLGSINDFGSDSSCPQGNTARVSGMDQATQNLICAVAGQIGVPVGTTGNPEIDLLVQNGLLTVCTQAQSQPLSLFPTITLSTTSTFYIEQPAAAPLIVTAAEPTEITAPTQPRGHTPGDPGNDELTYDIYGRTISVTIRPGDYDDSSDLATAVQTAINQAAQPQYLTPTVTPIPNVAAPSENIIELTILPVAYKPYVELDDLGGTAVSSGTLKVTGTGSTDNDLLESYDPNPVQACAGP